MRLRIANKQKKLSTQGCKSIFVLYQKLELLITNPTKINQLKAVPEIKFQYLACSSSAKCVIVLCYKDFLRP